MKYWKSALFATALIAAGSAFGYVEAVQDLNDPVKVPASIDITNNTTDNLIITGARFVAEPALSWGAPFSSEGYNQTVDGTNYRAQFLADNNGSGRVFGGGQTRGGVANWLNVPVMELQGLTPLIDAGGCADPDKPLDAPSIVPKDVDALIADPRFYDENYKYLDTLGSNGGEFSARWVDTFYGQTQIQWAIGGTAPAKGWSGALHDNTPGNADGPLYWMSLAGVQEIFSMDAQYLMSIGAKETGMGTTISPARSDNTEGAYGAFDLESFTGVSRFLTYPKFYPRYLDAIKANAILVPNNSLTFVALTGETFAGIMSSIFDTGDENSPATAYADPNSAAMVNSTVMSGLLIYQYYDMIGSASDYCGRRAFSSESADPYLGLCAIAGHYNLGINGGAPSALSNLKTIADPNGCDAVPQGQSDYVGTVRSVIEALTIDQHRWMDGEAGVYIIDKEITMADVTTYFWGDGGSKDAPGTNGLMFHFELDDETDDAFWADITTTFNKLSARSGGNHISFRYDWITVLRVAKAYFDTERIPPADEESNRYMSQHSLLKQCDNTIAQDEQWPFLTAQGEINGDFEATAEVYDAETGALYLQYSVANGPWKDVQPDNKFGNTTSYKFSVAESAIPEAGADVWIRAADSCKNEVTYKLRIVGAKVPYLDSAWAYDVDGDGYADAIDFAGAEHEEPGADLFKTLTKVDYQWPDASTAYSANAGEANLTISEVSGSINDELLSGGRASGGELAVTWSRGRRLVVIKDRVGPAVIGASMHEPTNPGQDDTLFVTFTEAVKDLSTLTSPEILNIDGAAVKHNSLYLISGSTWGFIYPTGVIDSTKEVNINHLSGFEDQATNPPLSNNIKKPIILNKGPVPLADKGHGFYDSNVDGKMDRVEIKFTIPLTQPQVDLMSFSVKWLQAAGKNIVKTMTLNGSEGWGVDPVDPTLVFWSIPDAEALRSNYTYINSSFAGMGDVSVSQASLDDPNQFVSETIAVPDKMGPIIVNKAGAILVKTPRPDIKADLLRITFSEPIKEKTFDHFFEYKKGSSEYHWANATTGVRFLAGGTALLVPFTPELLERPSIGDSVKIEVDNVYGTLIQDLAGNLAKVNNPHRIIDGKVIVIFFSPNIVEYNSELIFTNTPPRSDSKGKYQFGINNSGKVQAVIFPSTTTNTEIYEQYGMGFGFSVSFANDTNTVKRSDAIFKVNANIYSNLGQHVVNLSDEIDCLDVASAVDMQGTSGENACEDSGLQSFSPSTEFKVFYPWNFLTTEQRFAGSGAYFIKMDVEGPTIESGELKKTFGVIRGIPGKATKGQKFIDPKLP